MGSPSTQHALARPAGRRKCERSGASEGCSVFDTHTSLLSLSSQRTITTRSGRSFGDDLFLETGLMADLISQNDLDALWGPTPGDESQKQNGAKEETPASPAGLSQADLDALMGGSSEEKTASEEAGSSQAGLSQADLDALWGLAPADSTPQTAAPKTAEPEPSAPISENLSQDDIDKLLADFGK